MPKLKKEEDKDITKDITKEKELESSVALENDDDSVDQEGQKASDVTVNIQDKSKDSEKEPEKNPQEDETLKKLAGRMEYHARLYEKGIRELNEIKKSLLENRNPANARETDDAVDELDELAQKDWKAAVRKLGREEAERILKEEREKASQENIRQSQAFSYERSKRIVLEEYPDIFEDGSTEHGKLYRQVYNEDQSLLSNPNGPEIALYRMKRKMSENGVITNDVKPILDKEMARRQRAGASQVTGRANGSNNVILTKDQKQWCDYNGVDYKDYAVSLKASENGRVEV